MVVDAHPESPELERNDAPPHTRWLPEHHAAYTAAHHRWHRVIAALGTAVRELRQLLGWSQMTLATRAVTSQGAVSRVESGTNDSLPFTTVAKLLHALGHAARAAGLPLSPSTQALLTVVDPTLGTILAAEIDPQFAMLARAYHRCSAAQQAAIAEFLHAISDDLAATVADDAIPPPLEGATHASEE